jgi:[acyl-carrier-protein] S-malonyltransferase
MPFALVFPGQGSQRLGMLDSLRTYDGMERLLDAAEALSELPLRVIAQLGPDSELADTRAAQPLLFLADWAWGRAVLDAGAKPDMLAGHSLGEFAALAIAGVFSVEAGLEMVIERSRLMATVAASTPGGMAAVLGLEAPLVSDVVEGIEGVWVANENGPGQIVISGTAEGIEAARAALAEAGARRVIALKVAGPFHSPLMEPAADAFASEVLAAAAFTDARIPVVQNAEPTPTTDAETIRTRLALQITSPVRWTETMDTLLESGVTMLVEAGPGNVLSGMARRVDGLTAVAVEEAGVDAVVKEVASL